MFARTKLQSVEMVSIVANLDVVENRGSSDFKKSSILSITAEVISKEICFFYIEVASLCGIVKANFSRYLMLTNF